MFARVTQILAKTRQPFTQANSLPALSHNLTFIFADFPNQKCENFALLQYAFHFSSHILYVVSIFLSSCANFCMLTHEFSHRCTHCHHTHFIFTTKQSILASFITRIVAKNILHAHYVAKLRTFLLDITNFLLITNNLSAFFITASQCDIIFCHVCCIRLLLELLKNHFFAAVHFYHSFCMRKYCSIYTTHYLEWTKNNILLQDNY